MAWPNALFAGYLYLTTIFPPTSAAESHFSRCAMVEGRRRRELIARFEQLIATGFGEGILTFDEPASPSPGRCAPIGAPLVAR